MPIRLTVSTNAIHAVIIRIIIIYADVCANVSQNVCVSASCLIVDVEGVLFGERSPYNKCIHILQHIEKNFTHRTPKLILSLSPLIPLCHIYHYYYYYHSHHYHVRLFIYKLRLARYDVSMFFFLTICFQRIVSIVVHVFTSYSLDIILIWQINVQKYLTNKHLYRYVYVGT